METSFDDVKKKGRYFQWDIHLFSEINLLKEIIDELEEDRLKWQVTLDPQIEYINHLHYLLNPLMEKLPEDVTTNIQDLPDTYGVKVEAKLIGFGEVVVNPPGEQLDLAE